MLLLRISNTPAGISNAGLPIINPIYDSTNPTGSYVNTADQSQLSSVFLSVAAQIVHLTL
jgi:hypothetical protein